MRTTATQRDGKRVGGGGERPGLRHDLPYRKSSIDMRAKDGRHTIQRAGGEHGGRPLANLFRRLEHDEHITRCWRA